MSAQWINKEEAIYLTGKSERTISRWIKAHKTDKSSFDGEFINSERLNEKHPIIKRRQNGGNADTKNQNRESREAMQIMATAEIVKKKDEQIELLLNKKPHTPIHLLIGYSTLLIALFLASYIAFKNYRNELLDRHSEAINLLKNSNAQILNHKDIIIEANLSQIKGMSEVLNEQKSILFEQRQELAEKDRLISELYNDTKAQNKKLLELTENLQSKSVKNDTIENNSAEK